VLWLFGGSDSSGVFGDLWNYNLSTFSWTWVGGSSSLNSAGGIRLPRSSQQEQLSAFEDGIRCLE